MSIQALQRTQQIMNTIGQQLPSIAQAMETPGVDLSIFMGGMLSRTGVPLTTAVTDLVRDLCILINEPDRPA